jgi:putative component of toxin-antitoxin plasmid stabilization module
MAPERTYTIEFFEDENGNKPVRDWIMEDLSRTKRQAIGAAMQHVLQVHGIGVCGSEWGKQLGDGVFEFRVRLKGTELVNKGWSAKSAADESEEIVLRVFCHAYGDKLVLLLGGYDKGEKPSKKKQSSEIATARARLEAHRRRQTDARKSGRRAPGGRKRT